MSEADTVLRATATRLRDAESNLGTALSSCSTIADATQQTRYRQDAIASVVTQLREGQGTPELAAVRLENIMAMCPSLSTVHGSLHSAAVTIESVREEMRGSAEQIEKAGELMKASIE